MQMFEGSSIVLDIYHQMEGKEQRYANSTATALMITTILMIFTGSFSYSVYGQYTHPIVLLNLRPMW